MSDTVFIDARGLSCPQPVLVTKKTIEKLTGGRVEIRVDTVTSRENVARFGKSRGWTVETKEQESDFCVILTKKSS